MEEWDGKERRSPERPSDLHYILSILKDKIMEAESENKLNKAEIEHIKEDMQRIVEEGDKKHEELKQAIYQNVRLELNKLLNKIDILSSGSSSTNLSIKQLDTKIDSISTKLDDKVNSISKEVDGIKEIPQKAALIGWKNIGKWLSKILLAILIAALLFALTNQQFWNQLIQKAGK